ncbi:MAG: hypothetical protein D6741_21785, partial [Planctomycetota bacterium]
MTPLDQAFIKAYMHRQRSGVSEAAAQGTIALDELLRELDAEVDTASPADVKEAASGSDPSPELRNTSRSTSEPGQPEEIGRLRAEAPTAPETPGDEAAGSPTTAVSEFVVAPAARCEELFAPAVSISCLETGASAASPARERAIEGDTGSESSMIDSRNADGESLGGGCVLPSSGEEVAADDSCLDESGDESSTEAHAGLQASGEETSENRRESEGEAEIADIASAQSDSGATPLDESDPSAPETTVESSVETNTFDSRRWRPSYQVDGFRRPAEVTHLAEHGLRRLARRLAKHSQSLGEA